MIERKPTEEEEYLLLKGGLRHHRQIANPPLATPLADPQSLGALIKSVRKAKKLTQQELADLAGVGRRFIVECEAGKPRLEFAKVLQVAAATGIDIFAMKR